VLHDLDGKIECILKGAPSDIGLESTIVDCSGETPLLLRTGAVTIENLRAVVPSIRTADSLRQHEVPKSPGLKYPHYAPEARVVLLDAGARIDPDRERTSAYIGLSLPAAEQLALVKHCCNIEEYARVLFDFFRLCDARNISIIYCELPPAEGLGRAIGDRLTRAAAGR